MYDGIQTLNTMHSNKVFLKHFNEKSLQYTLFPPISFISTRKNQQKKKKLRKLFSKSLLLRIWDCDNLQVLTRFITIFRFLLFPCIFSSISDIFFVCPFIVIIFIVSLFKIPVTNFNVLVFVRKENSCLFSHFVIKYVIKSIDLKCSFLWEKLHILNISMNKYQKEFP